ncbi:hypothetical protein GQ42DRAFT_70371 [Ramicandelaber brevisporus]|nr:hypothetical protein GQ42DRAFT_70371 [Ramicandelaber brevisporus]
MSSSNTNSRSSLPVLIVGAGPVGLFTAYNLVRLGVPCRIIDKSPAISPHTRAIGVTQRTMEVFDQSGMLPSYKPETVDITGFHFIGFGSHRVTFSVENFPSKFKAVSMVVQPTTERILAETLERVSNGNVKIERGVEILSFEADADGVNVKLLRKKHTGDVYNWFDRQGNERYNATQEDGDVIEEARFSYMLGCDGAHSTIRKKLGWKFEGDVLDMEFAHGDCTFETNLPFSNEPRNIWNKNGTLMSFPLYVPGQEKYRLAYNRGPLDRSRPALTEEEFRRDIEKRIQPEFDFKLTAVDWCGTFTVHERLVERYVDDHHRIFLAGDAAHCHSPAGGLGMNTGLQDAYALSWRIAVLYHDLASTPSARAAIANSYNDERRPTASKVIKYSNQQNRQRNVDTWMSRFFRYYVIAWIPKFILERTMRRDSDCMLRYDINLAPQILDATSYNAKRIGTFTSDEVNVGQRMPDAELTHFGSKASTRLHLVCGSDALFNIVVVTAANRKYSSDSQLPAWATSITSALASRLNTTSPLSTVQVDRNLPVFPRPVASPLAVRAIFPTDVADAGFFGRLEEASVSVFTERNGDVAASLSEGKSPVWPTLDDDAVFVIRPDGYIGFMQKADKDIGNKLASYFDQFLS